jgi:hypothetical protein
VIWLVVPPCLVTQHIDCITVKLPLLFHVQKMLLTQSIFAYDANSVTAEHQLKLLILMLKAVWSSLMVFLSIKNYKPEYIVDIATLTGSSVGTLGYECGALFTNNETF